MKIATVKCTANGAVLSVHDPEAEVKDLDLCYQFDAGGELSQLSNMLWKLVEEMGWYGARHDKERISIAVQHGDKWAEKGHQAKSCYICRRKE